LLLFIRKGGVRYIALGALVLALQISGAGAGHMVRGWTFTAFIFTGLALRYLFTREWIKLGRVIYSWVIVVIIGLSLTAPVWLGIMGGVESLDSSGAITFKTVTHAGNSLSPGYLSTLLIPNLFGSVIGLHGWGVGRSALFDQANLLGGLLLIFLVIFGFMAFRFSSGAPERFWMILSGIGVVFAIFIVLGRHTPVYRFLYGLFPNFRIPYAIRWRDFECYSMALLAGASASLITRTSRLNKIRRSTIIIYLLTSASIIIFVISQPIFLRRTLYSSNIHEGLASGELLDSLSLSIPYLIAVLIVFLAIWLKPSLSKKILIGGVLFELITWGGLAFYLHHDWFGTNPLITKHNKFIDTPIAGIIPLRNRIDSENFRLFRTASYRSRLANSSWLTGDLSLFGYDCKPLLPRFNKAMHHIGPGGLIYEMVIDDWEARFLPNMSVDRAVVEAEQVDLEVDNPAVKDIIIPVVETDGPESRLVVDPVIVNVPDPLPRFFTQDRLVTCSEEEALKELVYGDLRVCVFVEESNQPKVKLAEHTDYRSFISDTASRILNPVSRQHFNDLQSINPITELDLSNPNRVELTIEMVRPAMLVMTDVWHPDWHVKVDDHPAELFRVNYLQRGLWLEKGVHTVIMTFVPQSWRLGRWGMLSGVLLILTLFVFENRRNSKR